MIDTNHAEASVQSKNSLLARFRDIPAALLHEAMGKRGALNHDVRPIYPSAKLVGSALTIQGYPGDNLMLHLAISLAQPGDALVATVGGYLEAGLWGEIASTAAIARQIQGLVTDGAVRDVTATTALGFPVFSRGVCIKGTTKKHAGTINQPITIAGVIVSPGDIVVGDADGVVVVPLSSAEQVLATAREIAGREDTMLSALREQRASTIDLLQLRPVIHELGLEHYQT